MRRVVLCAALLAACSLHGEVPSGRVACSADGRCPPGLGCYRGRAFPDGLCCQDERCDGLLPPDPDGGAAPPAPDAPVADPCDPLSGGCAPGQTCRPTCEPGSPSSRCEATGEGGRNARCARPSDCGPGLTCSAAACGGQCRPFCRTDLDCEAGAICLDPTCGTASDPHRVCTRPCDPRDAASCPAGSSCALLGRDITDCRCPDPAATVEEAGPCDEAHRCKDGLACIPEGSGQVCRPICRLDATATCPAGRKCVTPPGSTVYGGCSPITDPLRQSCSPVAVGACGPGMACRTDCGRLTAVASCVPSTGTAQSGEACDVDTDCADGLECAIAACPNGKEPGVCQPFCRTTADCKGSSRCVTESCEGDLDAPIGICSTRCDPVGKTAGCPAGLICALQAFDNTDCLCRAGGPNVGDGGTCDPKNGSTDCQPGLFCVTRVGVSTCRPVCRIGGKDCAADHTCVVLPEHRNFGVCFPTRGLPPAACDPASPASCTAASTNCLIECDAKPAAAAVCDKAGAAGVAEACTHLEDCVPGAMCFTVSCGETTAICRKFCKQDSECGGGSARCEYHYCGDAGAFYYGRCTVSCDPRAPATSGCPANMQCRLSPGNITDCVCAGPPMGGADGDPCTPSMTCQIGQVCVIGPTNQTCRPICRVDTPGTCPAGRACTPLTNQSLYGACLP